MWALKRFYTWPEKGCGPTYLKVNARMKIIKQLGHKLDHCKYLWHKKFHIFVSCFILFTYFFIEWSFFETTTLTSLISVLHILFFLRNFPNVHVILPSQMKKRSQLHVFSSKYTNLKDVTRDQSRYLCINKEMLQFTRLWFHEKLYTRLKRSN